MSKESPKDDPRQQTDWPSKKQTDKPGAAIRRKNSCRKIGPSPISKGGTAPIRIESHGR